jgi:hypothetical protein
MAERSCKYFVIVHLKRQNDKAYTLHDKSRNQSLL